MIDEADNVCKPCNTSSPTPEPTAYLCAIGGSYCKCIGTVYYGYCVRDDVAKNCSGTFELLKSRSFLTKESTGILKCDPTTMGGDPAPG
jgi:hypothetical protein